MEEVEENILASDKLAVLSRVIEYLEHESGMERLSTQEIIDIDALYDAIKGKGYEG